MSNINEGNVNSNGIMNDRNYTIPGNVLNSLSGLTSLTESVKNIEANLQSLERNVFQMAESLTAEVTRQVTEAKEEITALMDRRMAQHAEETARLIAQSTVVAASGGTHDDECELRITNIPSACGLPPLEIARRVLTAIHCVQLFSVIIDARVWNVPNRRTNDQRPPTRSIVFQLPSSLSRNKIMRASARLKNLPIFDILGVEAPGRLFIHQLLPKEIHNLFMRACERSSHLGYMKPFTRNLNVYVRPSGNVPPILIHSEDHLRQLQPLETNDIQRPQKNPMATAAPSQSSLITRDHRQDTASNVIPTHDSVALTLPPVPPRPSSALSNSGQETTHFNSSMGGCRGNSSAGTQLMS